MSVPSEAFKGKRNFMEWLQADDDIVEMAPFGVSESIVLEIGLVLKL